MRSFTPFLNGFFTATFLAVAMGSANAQTARKFGSKSPVVRLCPATCTAVNGHGFKAGASTTVYETKSGWARVSGYLDRAKLVASFGETTPAKPALWVPVSSLASAAKAAAPAKKAAAKKKPAAKTAKKKPKRVSVIDRLARLRNPALPSFRPGTVVASAPAAAQPEVAAVVETPTVETPIVETPVAETPVVETPAVEAPKVAAAPAVVDTQGGSQKALTWEEVQAKIARQKLAEQSGATAPAAQPVVSAPKTSESNTDEQAVAKKAAERKAALKAAALEREAKRAEAERLKQEAQKKLAAESKQKQEAAEAKRLADEKAAEVAKANADAAAKKAADAEKAAEAQKVAEAKKAEDAKAAAAELASKAAAASETPVALGADGKAVKLPPLASSVVKSEPTPEASKPVETAAVVSKTEPANVASVEPAGPEPTFTSAEADPIEFGKRPKKLTKALLDKRLRKLPGRKSKVKPEIIIAMRHSALGLLKSGECKGIAGGGKSAVPGMFYITCTEDPGYLRQFPIVEESW